MQRSDRVEQENDVSAVFGCIFWGSFSLVVPAVIAGEVTRISGNKDSGEFARVFAIALALEFFLVYLIGRCHDRATATTTTTRDALSFAARAVRAVQNGPPPSGVPRTADVAHAA